MIDFAGTISIRYRWTKCDEMILEDFLFGIDQLAMNSSLVTAFLQMFCSIDFNVWLTDWLIDWLLSTNQAITILTSSKTKGGLLGQSCLHN